MSFRELRSYLSKPGSSMIRLSMVGTTKLWVTRCAWTASSQACGSNWGRTTRVRPPQTEERGAVAPATWDSGTEGSGTSCVSGFAVSVVDVDEKLLRLVSGEELLVGRHAFGLRVVADEMLDRLELGPDGGGEVQVALADEDRLRLRVVHHIGELFLLAAVVEGG